MHRVLIIEGNESWKGVLCKALSSGYQTRICPTESEASRRLEKETYDVILLDMDLKPKPSDEMTFVRSFTETSPHTPVIVTSQSGKAELIVQAMKAGATDFIAKPYSGETIKLAISHALENRSLRNEVDYLRRQQDIIYDTSGIIAVSPAMRKIISMVGRLANTDSTVLVTGETGTGKSFISGAIHFNSPRRSRPFVKINCANIPEALLESELFGHEKGAFTGADKARAGRLEQANGGTAFLDEIGELSPALQAKLLRVMEEKAFERLGGNRTIHLDIRIIAATNRNLEEEVARGAFREDLYYRMNVLRVHLPPVRERIECIEPLAHHLLTKICRTVRKNMEGFAPEVLDLFKRYSWPGNIRELSNAIERAVILEDDRIIQLESVILPEVFSAPASDLPPRAPCSLNDNERELILDALKKCLWIQKDAAIQLGITRRVLNYKIKKYGITHSRWYRNN